MPKMYLRLSVIDGFPGLKLKVGPQIGSRCEVTYKGEISTHQIRVSLHVAIWLHMLLFLKIPCLPIQQQAAT